MGTLLSFGSLFSGGGESERVTVGRVWFTSKADREIRERISNLLQQ